MSVIYPTFCSVQFLPHLTIITYNQSNIVGMILQKKDKKCSKGEKYLKNVGKNVQNLAYVDKGHLIACNNHMQQAARIGAGIPEIFQH